MNSKLLYFATGAVIGSIITLLVVKERYQEMADEEIESVKKAFAKQRAAAEEAVNKSEEELRKYQTIVEKTYSKPTEEDFIHVIDSSEFGNTDYTLVGLHYFENNGVLTDENYDPIDDVKKHVGDVLEHFSFESDSIYIRNDAMKCDYEIVVDSEDYQDVVKRRPHRVSIEV